MANLNERSYPKGLREIRYPSNDVIHRFTSKDYTGEIRLNNETGEFEFNPPLSGTDSSGTTFVGAQAGHGFTVGQPIYHDGSQFRLANASAEDTLAVWVVVAVGSLDSFTAAQSGRFEISAHGLIPGQFYFVGETDGALTPTEPGTYSNPVIYVENADTLHVLPYRPSSATASAAGSGDVTSVFGRTGAVVAETGDYTPAQVGLGNVLNTEQIPVTEKAANNGVATLGGDGKVPASQLPASVAGGIDIIGFWDANGNTPDLSSLTLTQGQAYQVSVAGSTNLNGISTWALYDLAVWDNTISGNWFKLTSSGQVTSVNSQTGAVVLSTDDVAEGISNEYYADAKVSANTDVVANTAKVSADGSIDSHSDVDITSVAPSIGQTLEWDGSKFVPGTLSSPVQSVNSQTGVVILDADDINDTSTTNKWTTQAEIDKLAGIEALAEVNNISDANATDLTDGGDTSLHYHTFDRNRANHTGTQLANTISNFDSAVSSNTNVVANTAKISADGSIGTHSDVNMNAPAPSEGQVLGWDSINGYWHAIDQTGGGGAVDSVNGQTGVVVLNSDDISEGSSNLYNKVPSGGTTDQVLSKVDGTDYNLQWVDNVSNLSSIEKNPFTESIEISNLLQHSPNYTPTSSTTLNIIKDISSTFIGGTYQVKIVCVNNTISFSSDFDTYGQTYSSITGTYDFVFKLSPDGKIGVIGKDVNPSLIPLLVAPTIDSINATSSSSLTANYTANNPTGDIVSFTLQHDTVNTFDSVDLVEITGISNTAVLYLITSLLAETEYFVRIKAVGDGVNYLDSPYSNILSQTTQASSSFPDLGAKLQARWETNDPSTITGTTDVTVWEDKSTNNRDLVKGSDAGVISVDTDGSLLFPADQHMFNASEIFTGSAAREYHVVCSVPSSPPANSYLLCDGNGGAALGMFSSRLLPEVRLSGETITFDYTYATFDKKIYSFRMEAGGTEVQDVICEINGVVAPNESISTSTINTASGLFVVSGLNVNGTITSADGTKNIYAIVVTDELTTQERSDLLNYFNTEYII